MELRSLKQKHHETIEKVKALNLKQRKEGLTEAEDKELESLFNEGTKLKKDIESRQKFNALELQTLEKEHEKRPWKTEKRKYNFSNALAMLLGDKSKDFGFEKEIDQELRKGFHKKATGDQVLIPHENLWKNKKTEKRFVSSVTNISTTDIAGEEYVQALYADSLFDRLGGRKISHMGPYKFPASGGVTSSWFTGDGGDDSDDAPSESDPTYSSISQEPHFLGTYSGFSLSAIKNLVMGSPDLETILREDMTRSMQSELFNSFLNADNTAPKPNGLLNQITADNAIAVSATDKWKNEELLDVLKKLKVALKNDLTGRSINWLFSFSEEVFLKNTIKLDMQTDSKTLWSDNNMICGYPAIATNFLPNANATKALCGDWQDSILSEFGPISLEIGYIDQGLIKQRQTIIACGAFDFALRRTQSFQKLTITRS